jgi:hypothetical protein
MTQAKELVNRNTYLPLVIYIKECSSRDTGQGISQQEYIPSSCHCSLSNEQSLLRWKYVMVYLLANSLACVMTTILLNINDKRRVCIPVD